MSWWPHVNKNHHFYEEIMKALVDGDILVYKCGFAIEHSRYNIYLNGEEHFGPIAIYKYKKDIPDWCKDETNCNIVAERDIEPLENALQAIKLTIEAILQETGAKEFQIYLSGKDNFREKVSVTRVYKGNRDPAYKPRYYNEIKEYLVKYYNALIIDGMEADDAMGIEQYKNILPDIPEVPCDMECYSIICSIDKDLNQIPGWHYNFVKKEKYWIDENVARRNFYLQLLAGDIVDNIQGIKGMGLRGAEKALDGCRTEKEYYERAAAQYRTAYGDKGEEMLNEMAQLVWIRREPEQGWKRPS